MFTSESKNSNSEEQWVIVKKEMKRLDEIVANISSEKLPLDECLALYKEGQEIIKKLEKALKRKI